MNFERNSLYKLINVILYYSGTENNLEKIIVLSFLLKNCLKKGKEKETK